MKARGLQVTPSPFGPRNGPFTGRYHSPGSPHEGPQQWDSLLPSDSEFDTPEEIPALPVSAMQEGILKLAAYGKIVPVIEGEAHVGPQGTYNSPVHFVPSLQVQQNQTQISIEEARLIIWAEENPDLDPQETELYQYIERYYRTS